MSLSEIATRVSAQFQKIHGRLPRWIAAAPGRVNVIGEHTDYNDGFVLPMAIERYTVMAADFASVPGTISIRDEKFDKTVQIEISNPVAKGEPKWSNYIRGVIAGFQQRGEKIPSLDIVLNSTVPPGGGLSSSAALEVCAATLIEAAIGRKMNPVEKALLCQKAEHEFAGVPCGIMDQFISVMGQENHLLLLDCRSLETQLVPVNDPSVSFLIINTNVKHELGDGEYALRRAQCKAAATILGLNSLRDATATALENAKNKMDDIFFRRARHVIDENERTVSAAEHIRAADWPSAGRLMYESHYSLRDNYDVSCKELDIVVNISENIGDKGGIFGCRMTGGGFGGCAVALVKTKRLEAVSQKIAADYKTKIGIETTIFGSRPAAGATVIKS
jgi:galactokinase